MKRAKQLTKRERKALAPPRPQSQAQADAQHIHCIACGRHIDAGEFNAPATAKMLACNHGSRFPACTVCEARATALIVEHDRSGKNVQMAGAWH